MKYAEVPPFPDPRATRINANTAFTHIKFYSPLVEGTLGRDHHEGRMGSRGHLGRARAQAQIQASTKSRVRGEWEIVRGESRRVKKGFRSNPELSAAHQACNKTSSDHLDAR